MEYPEPFHDLYHQGAPEDIIGTDRESVTDPSVHSLQNRVEKALT